MAWEVRIERVRKLRRLIEALDGYRIGRYTDVGRVEELIDELGLRLPHDWSEVRRDIEEILSLPRRAPNYERLRKLEALSSRLSRANLAIIGVAILSYLAGHPYVFVALAVSSLVVLNVVYFLKAYVNFKISEVYASSLEELEALGARIKETVEFLLRQLRKELRSMGYRVEEFRLKLWVPDYSGIQVVKKPSILSSRYVVKLA
ncbi:MAG: hypothetical protein DRJ96_04745 [Thermoprotei archaeon]|nr:MAG: hypothetical protein DRJ67_00280 [Thermoprotei archaeon]RLE97116.1 MAG: hypothetical protein DRJ96_04745 [Thermoprotei archaeon]